MIQEEKDLLLKDLCARLPYGVKVFVSGGDFDNYQYPYLLTAISKFGHDTLCKVYSPVYTPFGSPNVENIKPYLRPMSSMTEEEEKEYESLIFTLHHEWDGHSTYTRYIEVENAYYYTDWLNTHHFDYHGLIEKNLALEAPVEMYR